MKQNRREFLASSTAAGIVLAANPGFIFRGSSPAGEPWYNRMRRCAQHNLNEYDPRILDVDGIFTNSWPDAGRPYLCNCESCKKLGPLKGRELHEKFLNRNLEICIILNSVVKEKRKDCVYNINIAGSIGATQNLKKIGDLAEWVNADHQSRGGNTPVWDCSMQGRVAYSIMKGKPVTNAVGTKTGPWRHSTNSEAEIIMWLAQTISSGMIPWLIWLGGELPDRRWRTIGQKYYNWLAKNEKHFINKRSLAKVGVVFSQRLNEYYNAPGRIPAGYGTIAGEPVGRGNPTDYLQGMYYALLEGRFLFDLIHETDLTKETLKQYSALILPNTALLDDSQVTALNEYVSSGGSVLATFETGLYNEWGERRKTHALGDIFNVALKPGYRGPTGQIFYMAIDRKHAIVEGFGDTDQLPGGEYHIPLEADGEHVLTIIPPYPNGIPEMVYPYSRKEMDYQGKRSNDPGIIIREKGQSRLVYLPIDIDRNTWIQGSTDLSKLLQKSIEWMINSKTPVTVKGELLRAEKQLTIKQEGKFVDSVIPSVIDFEVAALYT